MIPYLTDIAHYLNAYLQVDQYPQEKHGIWKPTEKRICAIGLALAPWPQLGEWLKIHQLNALFIHRPWGLDLTQLSGDIGLISYHLPFDEKLTLGYNLLLASKLSMKHIELLGEKEGRPLGITGEIPVTTPQVLIWKLENMFGPLESIHAGVSDEITSVAVMGAMNEKLILEAAQSGVQVYITGQFRKPAARVVLQTGLHVLATGHRESELLGLQLLAELLKEKWPALKIVISTC